MSDSYRNWGTAEISRQLYQGGFYDELRPLLAAADYRRPAHLVLRDWVVSAAWEADCGDPALQAFRSPLMEDGLVNIDWDALVDEVLESESEEED